MFVSNIDDIVITDSSDFIIGDLFHIILDFLWMIESDSNVLEAILYGSSVYRPETARDIDIGIVVRNEEVFNRKYRQKIHPAISYVIHEIPLDLYKERCLSYKTTGILLKDSGILKEYCKRIDGIMDLELFLTEMELAEDYLNMALNGNKNEIYKRKTIATAFNNLHHAAMTVIQIEGHTSTKQWGMLKSYLTRKQHLEFDNIVDACHKKNGYYKDNLDRDYVLGLFHEWKDRVAEFKNDVLG